MRLGLGSLYTRDSICSEAESRPGTVDFGAGWSSPVARWAHNPKVAGSNPAPATNLFRILKFEFRNFIGGVAQLAEHRVCNAGVRGSNPLTSTNALPICDCG